MLYPLHNVWLYYQDIDKFMCSKRRRCASRKFQHQLMPATTTILDNKKNYNASCTNEYNNKKHPNIILERKIETD